MKKGGMLNQYMSMITDQVDSEMIGLISELQTLNTIIII
jgi:hypothetical protein